jgi:hypothetical protein
MGGLPQYVMDVAEVQIFFQQRRIIKASKKRWMFYYSTDI